MLSLLLRGLGLTQTFEQGSGLTEANAKPKIPAKSSAQYSRLKDRGYWKAKPVHFGDKFKNLRL